MNDLHYVPPGTTDTACGLFARKEFKCTSDAIETTCRKCKRTRLVNGMLGGNVDISRKPRIRRKRRTELKPEPVAYCVFCKKEHEGGATCMGHYP